MTQLGLQMIIQWEMSTKHPHKYLRVAGDWSHWHLKFFWRTSVLFAGGTDTPILDFWWSLLSVSKRRSSHCMLRHNRILRFTSGGTPAEDLLLVSLYQSEAVPTMPSAIHVYRSSLKKYLSKFSHSDLVVFHGYLNSAMKQCYETAIFALGNILPA